MRRVTATCHHARGMSPLRSAAPRPRLAPAALPTVVAGLLAAAVVLVGLDQPLVEDGLFWWVPQGLWVAERGPAWSPAGELPVAVAAPLQGHEAVPQWAAGLPDYDHPPPWFWWLGLFLAASPTVQAVHLACLLPAVLAATGWVAVAARLGRPWAGLAPLGLPPVLAQLLRPDLDLPLLAIVPWALAAMLDRRWARAAALGLLAPWCKEPGVLLAAPAALAALVALGSPRRASAPPRALGPALAAAAPLLGLGLWRLVHGRLASPERLPDGLSAWLVDLGVVARLALWEQGRWLLLVGLLGWGWRLRRGRLSAGEPARKDQLAARIGLLAGFALTWLAFFAGVGFFATRDDAQSLTHVRYFLPGLAALAVLACAALPPRLGPALALPGLLWLTARSPFGPEASLFGAQAVRAEADATAFVAQALADGRTVWVGSYQAAALLQPWAGVTVRPPPPTTPAGGRLRIYAQATDPRALQPGDLLLAAAYGEPTGALERAWTWEEVAAWTRGEARVVAYEVKAPRGG